MPSSWLCPSDHVQSAVLALWPACHAGIGLLSRAAVHYMAADPQLGTRDRSSSLAAAADFRQMVAQLHEQGIEVLLQVSCAAPTSVSARRVLAMRPAPVMPSAGVSQLGAQPPGVPCGRGHRRHSSLAFSQCALPSFTGGPDLYGRGH